MVGNVPEALGELGLKCFALVAQPQILKGVIECGFHFLNIGIVGLTEDEESAITNSVTFPAPEEI